MGSLVQNALPELERQMRGMVDITVIGHSKGANLVLNYVQQHSSDKNLKNAVFIDAPSSLWNPLRAISGSRSTSREVPTEGPNVVNIYHAFDSVNNWAFGSVKNATNHLDTTMTVSEARSGGFHSRKGHWATHVLTVDLKVQGDVRARDQ